MVGHLLDKTRMSCFHSGHAICPNFESFRVKRLRGTTRANSTEGDDNGRQRWLHRANTHVGEKSTASHGFVQQRRKSRPREPKQLLGAMEIGVEGAVAKAQLTNQNLISGDLWNRLVSRIVADESLTQELRSASWTKHSATLNSRL